MQTPPYTVVLSGSLLQSVYGVSSKTSKQECPWNDEFVAGLVGWQLKFVNTNISNDKVVYSDTFKLAVFLIYIGLKYQYRPMSETDVTAIWWTTENKCVACGLCSDRKMHRAVLPAIARLLCYMQVSKNTAFWVMAGYNAIRVHKEDLLVYPFTVSYAPWQVTRTRVHEDLDEWNGQ